MIDHTIICVKWGNKYDLYVDKLKKQIEKYCSIPVNFYCLTDTPNKEYDIKLPVDWDKYYIPKRFWAYRKCYMFNENLFPEIKGNKFLYLDLDVLIHTDLKYFFELNMDKPYICRGWWNDINKCKKNYGRMMSTPLNSSVIRWNRNQLKKIYSHIDSNKEVTFFSYPTIDNYFNHNFYNVWNENDSFFNVFKKGDIYSWYRGNIFPEDMQLKKLRLDHKICLFNNSALNDNIEEHMYQITEIKNLW